VGNLDFRRVLLLAVGSGAVALSQVPTPAVRRVFEVASIKPNRSAPQRGVQTNPFEFTPGGRFTATNVTLVDIIVMGYQTRRIQMQGGPDWIDSERFDIVAKADVADGEVKAGQWSQMLQALLEERFKLAFHRETKEMSVLALVGKLPSAFQESKEGQTAFLPGEHGRMTFRHMQIAGLVNTVANVLRTPVIDGTGIKGFYDFALDPMQLADTGSGASSGAAPSYANLLETALLEQLGFKLENRKAPLEIMVIDHASRPTEN